MFNQINFSRVRKRRTAQDYMNIIERGRAYNNWAAQRWGAGTPEYERANMRYFRLYFAASDGYRRARSNTNG